LYSFAYDSVMVFHIVDRHVISLEFYVLSLLSFLGMKIVFPVDGPVFGGSTSCVPPSRTCISCVP